MEREGFSRQQTAGRSRVHEGSERFSGIDDPKDDGFDGLFRIDCRQPLWMAVPGRFTAIVSGLPNPSVP